MRNGLVGLSAGLPAGWYEIVAVGARCLDQEEPVEEIQCIAAVAVVIAGFGDPAVGPDLDSLYIEFGAAPLQSPWVAEKEHFVVEAAELAVDQGRMPEHIGEAPGDHCCLHPENCLS